MIKDFACDESCGRLDIEKPWISDGWLIATDGRAIAMVPCNAKNTTPEDGMRYPDFGIINRQFDSLQFTPWRGYSKFPQKESKTMGDCDSCGAESFIVNVIIGDKCFDQRFINRALTLLPEGYALDGDLLLMKCGFGRVAIMASLTGGLIIEYLIGLQNRRIKLWIQQKK